ncbi:MAG: DUF1553 domain-containing protein [Chitinophagaceae bacterium]|nr:DUF1553 domain-containing protein [Chitinophagaceae bacterium]MCW5926472.1 DUF1553 domain-containing protein [Chitinophagaceae bacterium]
MVTKRIRVVLLGTVLLAAILFIGIYGFTGKLSLPANVQQAMDALPEELDYNIHVKKILSDKCFSCHGPDSKKQKGDLRLDVAEVAYAKVTESGRKAIRPGNIAGSEVANRILSDDPEYRMPTPSSHLALTAEEKAVILKWIAQGARYKPHWAFETPQKPAIPRVRDEQWSKNEIDRFVLARLEKENLEPSPEADKETLIRRVSFDLTGLPPTTEEINAFLANTRASAYEEMVDHYLQSPRYGERMAAYWLDVARFADSHGYLDDKHRDASPWRDWVIAAYNKNLPYDQFITWQLAGDLLPDATKEQILATGFNRNQKQNTEAGIISEEFRVEYNVDRTNTLGTGILGLTLSCAKCHDHKYDPVSQKEYYSLYAFFNSTFELGSSNYGNYHNMVPGPTLLLSSDDQDRTIDSLHSVIRFLERQQKPAEVEVPAEELARKIVAHLSFDKTETLTTGTGKEQATGPVFRNHIQPAFSARSRSERSGKGVSGNSLLLEEETRVNFSPYGLGYFERYEPFAISIWVKAPETYEESAILHHSDSRRYGFQGYDLLLKDNQLNFRLMHAFPHDAISVISQQRLELDKWHHIAVSYDGSSRASGVSIFIDGKEVPVTVEYDDLKKNTRSFPDIHKTSALTGLSFGARVLEKTMKNAELDEFYLFDNTIGSKEADWLFRQKAPGFPAAARKISRQPDSLMRTRMQLAAVYDSIREVMVMGDLPEPRTTHVLLRGMYDSYGEEVEPGTPAAVLAFPDSLPRNRLGLAKWLFLPGHPLTSRIAVNHAWEMYFGRGLVKTSDDFGNQGDMPSHPELMDYLAVKFREEGWNLKQLQKFILMSATYRQQSIVRPELLERDPDNSLLARSSRYRMPAEMIRDQALAISGLLSSKIGGPSVYPYQPPGLWEALSDKSWRYIYTLSEGEDLFRRSIYTVVKRSSPPPYMLIFDAPDRNFCTVKRPVSSSPLQALALMNDPTFIEASKFIATRMLQEGGSENNEQLAYGFRLVTGRMPDDREKALLDRMFAEEISLYKKQPEKAKKILSVGNAKMKVAVSGENLVKTAAYTSVAMALLNTDEFVTRK